MIVDENKTSLQSYMSDIGYTKPLSREREAELAKRIQQGDLGARNELVAANLRFVIDVAGQYRNRDLAFPELISAGNQGLLQAAERFDGSRGFKFITYAIWWIRQAICKALADQSRPIRLPANKVGLLKEIAVARSHLGRKLEDRVGVEDIAEEIGVAVKTVSATIASDFPLYSLDELLDESGGGEIYEFLADNKLPAPDENLIKEEGCSQIEKILAHLNARERHVIRLYFGLGGEAPLTLEKIGAEMGLTRERIRQIKEQALAKLRESQLNKTTEYMEYIG